MSKKVKTIYSQEYKRLLETLVALRQEAGLTQRDLAKRLGTHHSWVAKVELGERRLDVIETVRLIKVLGGDPVGVIQDIAKLVK
jgi:transcriptional regulator with XRE-family HTH domain